MNIVAWPLEAAIEECKRNQIAYSVVITKPDRVKYCLEERLLYVVRQQMNDNGTCLLTCAAKMGKEEKVHP
ncbi:MAG: hypothetical protein H6Q67_342 [Firmicutes bacterium]|nr:hypothetical protein [Bacillota bacterium]